MRAHRSLPLFLSLALLVPLFAHAVNFPDVGSDNPHKEAIEGLAALGVISGNPDGTFRPMDPVNRAAMLKMLYKAAGKTPSHGTASCFSDVQEGSWYETFVCDAAAQGFVKGYGDGTFKPAKPVTRAEALKMTLAVFGELPAPDATDFTVSYTDVGQSDWYFPYVGASLSLAILPIAGQEGPNFLPNEPLQRDEAAAYIWNATQKIGGAQTSSVSSAASSEQATGSASSQQSSRKSASFDDTGASAQVLTMKLPFDDIQGFKGKKTFSYRFHVDAPMVVDVTASLQNNGPGEIRCTLFRLTTDGLSTEYYLGYVEGFSCSLHTAVTAGDYQLQLQPTAPDTSFIVQAKAGVSADGNDGFSQAKVLESRTRTESLDANDLEDWYIFTVKESKQMTLSLVSTDKVRCLIYPSDDVDLYGFSGPECNASYLYPTGTYYVGIGHVYPKAARQVYTLQLR